MPQKTNLNISPYYDDFNKEDQFYRVLFKPGFPVQARELTTLQSSLQNQIESFGSHIFKDGSMVIPGNINYDSQYYSVRINSEHLGIPVTLYLDQLIGLTLRGQSTGITLKIDSYQLAGASTEINDLTIFVQYIKSGTNNEISFLDDGEVLITEQSFVYGNTAVNEGETILTLVDQDASAIGSAVGISSGTYFIRGSFVDVSDDKIVLDPYTNDSSYRVGLNINEELVTAKDDDSLFDNARGFSNYAAPGADRLKISTTLAKKSLTDFNDTNFIELLRIENGELKVLITKSDYNIIKDYFATRTFDESGHYSINQFKVQVENSLNDGISNDGLFKSDETTQEENTPSDDLMCIKVSAGKAYVKGYDIELAGTQVIDIEKPRDKREVSSALVPYQMGTILKVNNVFGLPAPNIVDTTYTLLLTDKRTNSNTAQTGDLIGRARAYSFNVSDAAYSGDSTQWDLHVFDLQIFTKLIVNKSLTSTELPQGSFIRGVSSGANGYADQQGDNGLEVVLSDITGKFIPGEQIVINEDTELSRSVGIVTSFGLQDVKSIYQDASSVSGGQYKSDFVADVVLNQKIAPSFSVADELNIGVTGVATCAGRSFSAIKPGTIIRYQLPDEATERFNRIDSVASDGLSVQLIAVPSVTGVCNGAVPSTLTTTTFKLGFPDIKIQENRGLFAPIGNSDVSDVNLSNSTLVVGVNVGEQTTDGNGGMTVSLPTGITSAFYESFDEERYSVHYSDGSIENLTSDQFSLGADGQSIIFTGLTASQSNNVHVSTTLKKQGIQSKQKNYIRSQKVAIDRTAVGINTALTGLVKSSSYGLRIEDREISLNYPDAIKVVGVYESIDSDAPTLDRLTFPSGLSLDTNAIIGEKIIGKTSEAIAQITSIISSTQVEIAYLNSEVFTTGEVVNFDESSISTTLQLITTGSALNITNIFKLDKGQRDQFYDYSRIVRKQNFSAPSRKLLIIFDRYDVPTNDTGDFYTVESYGEERFSFDIPSIGAQNIRSSDTIDFRPRVVSPYAGSISPFVYQSRNFDVSTNPQVITTPNESSILGYKYYLPRIDKVILDPQGNLFVLKGDSNIDPKPPTHSVDSMQIASITLPAYLYNPNDAKIEVIDNTRYTMRDIGGLEDRIENLETTTSLSLLELDTKTLQVQDADGLSRFKTGFFVDDFKNSNLLDSNDPDCRVTIDSDNQEMVAPIDYWSIPMEVALDPSLNVDTVDFSENHPLLDSNCRKTGETITLDYEEVTFLDQPLASRVENVNPFNMIDFDGIIQLKPFTDSWVRTIRVNGGTIRRTGTRDRTFTRTEVVSVETDSYIRSRNVSFDTHSLKPQTRVYPFFDDTSGIDIIPKLLQIEMKNGIFEVGETVDVFNKKGKIIASFRLCRPDHKRGPINKPKEKYKANPYDTSVSFGKKYSASSDVMNIDIVSLSNEAQGKYFGFVKKSGTTILGRSSGAQASIKSVKLITDVYGDILGSFFFRDPLSDPPPSLRFKTGISTFKLTSSKKNKENLPGSVTISDGETTYETDGLVETIRRTTIIETAPPPPPPRRRGRRRRGGGRRGGQDPLAQSFTVDETGIHLTAVDLFFGSKDSDETLIVEVRTMELGTPTNQLVDDFSQVFVNPDDIKVSDNASKPTRVTFPSPVHLEPGREYAIVLISPTTNNYEAWVARMGEKTVNSQNLPDAESVLVTKQYIGGSLFKSQNGTIWTASQFEDLKIKLYKAKFSTTPGSVFLYNPKLDAGSDIIARLTTNAIKTLPRKLKVGITTTYAADIISNLDFGKKVIDSVVGTAVSGYIEQVGGPILINGEDAGGDGLVVTNAGVGYANGTYSNVSLYSVTGKGTGAVGIVTVTNNGVSAIRIAVGAGDSGNGYVIGDVLGITTGGLGNSKKGAGALISVQALKGRDTLYMNNTQGEEFTTGQPVRVFNGANIVSYANTTFLSSAVYDEKYTGNVIEVSHYNHGMESDNNLLTIQDVEPNTPPIEVTDFVDVDDLTISVASTANFASYNGIPASQGYVKINSEIIYYDSIGTNTLGIGTRGIDNTKVRTHDTGSIAYKYELNGFDLRKINNDQTISDNTALSQAKTIDSYYIECDRGVATGDNQTSFTNEQNLGGSNIFASQNYQFDSVIPDLHTFTPSADTKLTAQIRTVSGTSAGGNEISFIDKGFEGVTVYQSNKLDSPRIVCNRRNEIDKLSNLPKRRSFTLAFRLETSDPNLSPTVNLNDPQVILERTRLNKPIEDYVKDGRSNQSTGDPHAGVYISNRIDLKNPATSLKVFLAAYRHPSADFRLLYQLIREDGTESELSYELFPGFDNLTDTNGDNFGDQIIDVAKNSGKPDTFVPASKINEFKEYQFSIDNLEEFVGFKFKLVMSGTNEAYAPRFKDFRAIALA